MVEYIERDAAVRTACKGCNKEFPNEPCEPAECHIQQGLFKIPAADVVEVDKVAKLLLLSFGGDTCACNFNCNDEWLWEKCKYGETECPYPQDELGCWKEYVKAMLAKMDGKGEGNGQKS